MKYFLSLSTFLIATLLLLASPLHAQELVDIRQFGAVPNSKTNTTIAVKKALQYCSKKENVTLYFPTGRYDFWPIPGERGNSPFYLDHAADGLTIDGKNSNFVFHERIEVARANGCKNLTYRNFTIDWERPYVSQATIVNYTSTSLDIRIDETQYPYTIEQGKLLFLGEGWKLPVLDTYNNLYDEEKKGLLYNTWDRPLGNIFQQKAEALEKGIVRLHGELSRFPPIGSHVALLHLRYGEKAFAITGCTNVLYQNIKVYHALGMGFIATKCENVTFDNAYVCVNKEKGRVFSAIADATHIGYCKGMITLDGVHHTGQFDDFMNVHNGYSKITGIIDDHTIEVDRGMRVKNGGMFLPGEEVWFIDSLTKQRHPALTVLSNKPGKDDQGKDITIISFRTPIPDHLLMVGNHIENKSWNPSVTVRNSTIGRTHRARGLLFCTPEKVLIENNHFSSAGPAIWLQGDFDLWDEAGPVCDVLIRNNTFEDCLSSGSRDGFRYQWGHAVITIAPGVWPQSTVDSPYHRNITITNNTFKAFDVPVLFARSVGNLNFTNNTIIKTNTYRPYTFQRSMIALDGCRQVRIIQNQFDPAFKERYLSMEHMEQTDLQMPGQQGLSIKPHPTKFLF